MFEHYLAYLLGLRQARELALPALPDAPVQPAPAGANGSAEWDPCPCRQWGVARDDRHGCVALCKELFPQLDAELDAWEAEHGWLYR
jgi:hypothetical protein